MTDGTADISAAPGTGKVASKAPAHASLVLLTLILVAAVANLNLAVANIALPEIGQAFDAGQTSLNLVAVGYSLGLATSVLYLGALGDRYGRKMMLILGTALSVPACLLAAFAPSIDVLFLARLFGGIAAGMAYPTTLAIITALWSGPGRTKAIALWSAIGGAASALGPLGAGGLLEVFDWGSVFLLSLPFALIALVLSIKLIPSHVNEATEPVDNLGGILSVILVAALTLAINFAAVPNAGTAAIGLGGIAVAALIAFFMRQRRAANPLFDLSVAKRPTFWVAALAGLIVFGSLMGAMFIGQQYVQNVLEYSTLAAGATILPAALAMVVVAPKSAKLIESHGSRFTLLLGYLFCLLGFVFMLVFWTETASVVMVCIGYLFLGVGVGLAGTPASRSLTGSVPVRRAGMASGTADLQRDLGGAIMQSILGVLLTAGYASAFASQIAGASNGDKISDQVQAQLQKSFSSAAQTAEQYPQYSQQIIHAAQTAFLDGGDWAYLAAILAVIIGAGLVFFLFPKHEREKELLAGYAVSDD